MATTATLCVLGGEHGGAKNLYRTLYEARLQAARHANQLLLPLGTSMQTHNPAKYDKIVCVTIESKNIK